MFGGMCPPIIQSNPKPNPNPIRIHSWTHSSPFSLSLSLTLSLSCILQIQSLLHSTPHPPRLSFRLPPSARGSVEHRIASHCPLPLLLSCVAGFQHSSICLFRYVLSLTPGATAVLVSGSFGLTTETETLPFFAHLSHPARSGPAQSFLARQQNPQIPPEEKKRTAETRLRTLHQRNIVKKHQQLVVGSRSQAQLPFL